MASDGTGSILIIPLQGAAVDATTASANGTGKDLKAAAPETLIFVARVTTMDGASKTVDAKLQTSHDNATWVDVTGCTATQFTAVGIQRMNVPHSERMRYYRSVAAAVGTFGAGEVVGYDLMLIGADCVRLPVTQIA
jgi:hypothetical protein